MIADNMLASKRATLTEIAEKVLGYQSYSGFWKMYSKATGKTNEKEVFKSLEKMFDTAENKSEL